MLPLNLKIFIIATLTIAALSQSIYFHSPQQLKDAYPNGIKVRLSPIGFNPRSGQLDGTLVMASPFDACSPISNVQNEEEDVFVLANDETCLQSIKSRNILKSGALMGIIKQNVNTTMHDKELDIVHIPIIQLGAQAFDNITKLLTGNTSTIIMASIKFGSDQIMREINTQLWMSPTQTDIYTFLINMEKFFNNQENQVNFIPRYAMHSQKDRKSFIGCYSNGMYCPGELQYDGKIEGQNVIEESLRQVIIRGMSLQKWWRYIKYYYVQCLHNSQGDVFWSEKSLQICTRNSMMLAEIDYEQVEHQMSQSFMGPRKQVDDNIWLHEQRKDYIKQKISQYPVLLINKKEFTNFNENEVKLVICKMEHNRSQECSQLMDGKLHNSEVFLIMGIVMVIIVLILIGYKVIMYKRMQIEMKSQVTSTLEQYYRYMETLEGDESQPKIYKGKPDSAIDIRHDSTKQNQQTQQSRQVEIQMTGSVNPQKKRKNTKEGHETLVEEQQN